MKNINETPSLITSKIENEVIMMSEDMEKYFGMNSVANQIWVIWDSPKYIDNIVDELLLDYNITK